MWCEGYVHGTLQILILVEQADEIPVVALSHGAGTCCEAAVVDGDGNDVEVYFFSPFVQKFVQGVQFGQARFAGDTPDGNDGRLATKNFLCIDLFPFFVFYLDVGPY